MLGPRGRAASSVAQIGTRPRFMMIDDSGSRGDCANRFESLILESLDETLGDLLGRRAREAVYDHLERNCFIARSEIPSCLDDLFSVLETTFGKGSKIIGKVIVKRIYGKLGWEFTEVPNLEFRDYLGMIKTRLER
jgi:hypothetical protein